MVTLSVNKLGSLAEKSIGLIRKKKIESICFSTRWGIHTFGVLAPIDVVILDDHHRVVKIGQHIAPNRIFFWNPRYKNVLELPHGEIVKRGIMLGSTIKILADH